MPLETMARLLWSVFVSIPDTQDSDTSSEELSVEPPAPELALGHPRARPRSSRKWIAGRNTGRAIGQTITPEQAH